MVTKTLGGRLLAAAVRQDGPAEYPEDVERPRTRQDCLAAGVNGERPCPWVSCRWHLYLDVNPETGSVKLNFPDKEVWELKETCALDVADREGISLEETASYVELTRERVRQLAAETADVLALRLNRRRR